MPVTLDNSPGKCAELVGGGLDRRQTTDIHLSVLRALLDAATARSMTGGTRSMTGGTQHSVGSSTSSFRASAAESSLKALAQRRGVDGQQVQGREREAF